MCNAPSSARPRRDRQPSIRPNRCGETGGRGALLAAAAVGRMPARLATSTPGLPQTYEPFLLPGAMGTQRRPPEVSASGPALRDIRADADRAPGALDWPTRADHFGQAARQQVKASRWASRQASHR